MQDEIVTIATYYDAREDLRVISAFTGEPMKDVLRRVLKTELARVEKARNERLSRLDKPEVVNG